MVLVGPGGRQPDGKAHGRRMEMPLSQQQDVHEADAEGASDLTERWTE